MNETVKIIFDILQTIILGIGLWYIQRSAKKRDEKRDRQNIADNTWKQCITKGVDGNSSLCLSNAKYIRKYHPETNKAAIKKIIRVSSPGLRQYTNVANMPRVLNGLGIAFLSTSKGIITNKEARDLNVGGEVLCYVY